MNTSTTRTDPKGRRSVRRSVGRGSVLAALAAAGILVAACSSSATGSSTTTSTTSNPGTSNSSTSAASSATVRTADVTGVGKVLVNSAGRTLYLFSPDKQSTSTCSGACATTWPPLMASGTPGAGTGLTASLLGTVHNPDGSTQVTYNHWPLYTFEGDSAAGQAHGQGLNTFGGHWTAVDVQGMPASASSSTSGASSTSTTGAGGGYGY